MLFIPETENAEKGHIKLIHQAKNWRPMKQKVYTE